MGDFCEKSSWRKKGKTFRRFFNSSDVFYERVRIKRRVVVLKRTQSSGEAFDIVVNATHQTEQNNAYYANAEGCIAIAIVFEGRERVVIGIDVHRLHDEQVVVERDHRVDQRHEHQPVPTGVEGGHEDEELREETCEGGNACQREQAERHDERELGIGAVKSIVIVNAYQTAVLLYDIITANAPMLASHIDEEIENHGCHALVLCRP